MAIAYIDTNSFPQNLSRTMCLTKKVVSVNSELISENNLTVSRAYVNNRRHTKVCSLPIVFDLGHHGHR